MRLHIRPKSAVIALTVLAVISITVALAILLWGLRKHELEHATLETTNLTRMLMEQTQQAFDGTDLIIRGVQERLQTAYGSQFALDSAPVHLLLAARISGISQIGSLFIVSPEGMVINSSREHPIAPLSVTDREYYKAFISGRQSGLFVGTPVHSRRVGESWTLHLARAFYGTDGKMRGIVVAGVNLDYFERLYTHMKLDFVRPIALYLADGVLVASLPHRENVIGSRALELAPEQLPTSGDDVRVIRHVSGDGGRSVFSLGHVARFPLLVSVIDDEEETLASWRETAVPIALGAVLVNILIIVAAGLLGRELAREATLTRALREADDRYQRTIESVMDAIVAIDESQNILIFNAAAERMFGISAAEAIGSPLKRLIPERLRDEHLRNIDGFMHTSMRPRAMAPQAAIVGRRADGSEFPIESTISQTMVDGKPQLTAVLRDVTERRRVEADMLEMNRQLRELSQSLQGVREEERARISLELHDELGQQLTGLKLDLTWMSSRLRDNRPVPQDKLDAMRHTLDEITAAVRRIAAELRPRILDDLGFDEAVAWQTGEFAKRSGVEVVLDLPAAERVTDDALATALFRTVQESLTNVVRHAGATRAEISLVEEGGRLILMVSDNGEGFGDDMRKGGLGLVSMRERATALGGAFQISSSPGRGTTVQVTIPLAQQALAGVET